MSLDIIALLNFFVSEDVKVHTVESLEFNSSSYDLVLTYIPLQTDTISVLLEATVHIRFLEGQIEALSSPYMNLGNNVSGNTRHQHSVNREGICYKVVGVYSSATCCRSGHMLSWILRHRFGTCWNPHLLLST